MTADARTTWCLKVSALVVGWFVDYGSGKAKDESLNFCLAVSNGQGGSLKEKTC